MSRVVARHDWTQGLRWRVSLESLDVPAVTDGLLETAHSNFGLVRLVRLSCLPPLIQDWQARLLLGLQTFLPPSPRSSSLLRYWLILYAGCSKLQWIYHRSEISHRRFYEASAIWRFVTPAAVRLQAVASPRRNQVSSTKFHGPRQVVRWPAAFQIAASPAPAALPQSLGVTTRLACLLCHRFEHRPKIRRNKWSTSCDPKKSLHQKKCLEY